MANGDSDWKTWGIRLAFGLLGALLPITISLAALSYYNLRGDITKLENTLDKHANMQTEAVNKQSAKIDQVCAKVSEHDTLLRLPWQQRREFYQFKINEFPK